MNCLHNVVAASATVGLLGREGITLRKTILADHLLSSQQRYYDHARGLCVGVVTLSPWRPHDNAVTNLVRESSLNSHQARAGDLVRSSCRDRQTKLIKANLSMPALQTIGGTLQNRCSSVSMSSQVISEAVDVIHCGSLAWIGKRSITAW